MKCFHSRSDLIYALTAACQSLTEALNMEALGGTDQPTSTQNHTVDLSGVIAGSSTKVLAKCRMEYSPDEGVTLELSVRSDSEEACKLVMSAIA